MYKLLVGLFLFLAPLRSLSQVLPVEGSKLCYRLAGFSFPSVRKAHKYTVQIAAGNYNTADSFRKHIILSPVTETNKLLAEVPAFGSQYTWRVVCNNKKGIIEESPFYHFSTMRNDRLDTGKLRLRILQAGTQYKDDYVFLDGGGLLCDMDGRPIWFVPDTNGFGGYVTDLQFTAQGTITFMFASRQAYEINLNGTVLWKAPTHDTLSGDTSSEVFHHEFMRLADGHYMVLGMQFPHCKTIVTKDSTYVVASNEKLTYKEFKSAGFTRGHFGMIIEYDEKGNVVWSWKTLTHLLGSDYDYFSPADTNAKYDPHDNAFYFDEQKKVIYLGFRNLNRIMKIEYPSGKVLDIYGQQFKPGATEKGSGWFCNQHSIARSQEGYLYYFDNNSCHGTQALPEVVMLQEPVSANDTLKKVWEYTCSAEGNFPKKFGSGGNVIELPDRSLFVNMGSDYSKLFIVDRDKKVLWSALPESYIPSEKRWAPVKQYRANIINRKVLERLVWNAESADTVR